MRERFYRWDWGWSTGMDGPFCAQVHTEGFGFTWRVFLTHEMVAEGRVRGIGRGPQREAFRRARIVLRAFREERGADA